MEKIHEIVRSVLLIGMAGIALYGMYNSSVWHRIAVNNANAYYRLEEEQKKERQFYSDAGIGYVALSPGHYPIKTSVSSTTGKMILGFSEENQDRTKPFIATTSEIAFKLGCDIDLKTRRVRNSLTLERDNYGPIYNIKCDKK